MERVGVRTDAGLVDFRAIEFRYPKFLLGPLTLKIDPGAAVALVGPNGAGKTTLLGILSGHRVVSAGTARILGINRDQVDPTIREHVAIVPTRLLGLRWMTVREHFDFLSHFYSHWDMTKALEMAEALNLKLDYRLRELSRGQSLKVSLCGALGQGARLLLFDEPTAGLDPVARNEALRQIHARGLAAGVMILVLSRGEFNPSTIVGLFAAFLIYLPVNLALNMTQEKIDGSLRFLSSLPVTGREHAASRVLATAALTTPLVIWLATTLPLFQLESLPGGPVVTGIGMGMAVFLASLVVIAFQYRYSGQKARSILVYAGLAFVVVLWISTWFEGLSAVIRIPAVIVTGALVSLIGAMATGRYVLRTIVRLAPVYDGENDELAVGVAETDGLGER